MSGRNLHHKSGDRNGPLEEADLTPQAQDKLLCYGYRRVILDDHLRTLGRPGRGVVRPGRYASGARPNCKYGLT